MDINIRFLTCLLYGWLTKNTKLTEFGVTAIDIVICEMFKRNLCCKSESNVLSQTRLGNVW